MSDTPHEHLIPGRMVLLGMAGLVVLAMAAAIVISQASRSRHALPILGEVPPFEFQAQLGGTFGRDDLEGRVNIVCFFFTRCQTVCPVMIGRCAELYQLYAGSNKVRLVSISVDPLHDSLDVLREYAADFGVTDDRWVFLWEPDLAKIVNLSEKGFMLPAENLPGGHSGKMVLVDTKGLIRGYYGYDDDEAQRRLEFDTRALVQAMR